MITRMTSCFAPRVHHKLAQQNKTKGKKREDIIWWCTTQGNCNEISIPKWKGCTTKDTMAKTTLTCIEKNTMKRKNEDVKPSN